jgi:hypothetical protein
MKLCNLYISHKYTVFLINEKLEHYTKAISVMIEI